MKEDIVIPQDQTPKGGSHPAPPGKGGTFNPAHRGPREIRFSELRSGDVEIVGYELTIPKEYRQRLAAFLSNL